MLKNVNIRVFFFGGKVNLIGSFKSSKLKIPKKKSSVSVSRTEITADTCNLHEMFALTFLYTHTIIFSRHVDSYSKQFIAIRNLIYINLLLLKSKKNSLVQKVRKCNKRFSITHE